MRPDDGTELDDDDLGSRPEPRPQPLGQPLGPFRRVEVVYGDIDSEAISQAIDQMLLVRPYLAASNGATPTPSGSADGGAQGPAHMGSSAGQLTRDDLSSMSAEQIAKAKADGRLNVLLGIS